MLKKHITEGKRYTLKTHINEMLLPREEAETLEAFYVIIEPGKATHAHSHPGAEQLYYVISGAGEAHYTFPDGRHEEIGITPGDVVYIPRNTEHQIFCTSDESLTYLCVDGFVGDRSGEKATWDEHFQSIMRLPAQR